MDNRVQTRRQWVTGLVRAGLLSILAVVSTVLMRRSADGRCVQLNPCGDCGRLARCQLPAALEWKRR